VRPRLGRWPRTAVALADRSSSCTDGADWGPAQPPVPAGRSVASGYEVIGHLRRGRRLDVYDVWDIERGCRCVAKTLRPERAGDAIAAGHLRIEGDLLATLAHPHLVRAYETTVTSEHPRPVVVLETLTGHTVDHLIDEHGALPGGDVALLGMQVASAVSYLHRHGWLHLDLKPSNVINVDGRAVLLDLSLAAHPGQRCSGGTFDYLSPEQACSDAASEATDVWGLGATLYEALAGAPPFADHPHRGLDGQRRYPQAELPAPSLRTRRRRCPRDLADIVDACLRHEPSARPTLAQLVALLADWSGIHLRQVGA
jgi:eukaryotic-like serine/threonine-protein kinase